MRRSVHVGFLPRQEYLCEEQSVLYMCTTFIYRITSRDRCHGSTTKFILGQRQCIVCILDPKLLENVYSFANLQKIPANIKLWS